MRSYMSKPSAAIRFSTQWVCSFGDVNLSELERLENSVPQWEANLQYFDLQSGTLTLSELHLEASNEEWVNSENYWGAGMFAYSVQFPLQYIFKSYPFFCGGLEASIYNIVIVCDDEKLRKKQIINFSWIECVNSCRWDLNI